MGINLCAKGITGVLWSYGEICGKKFLFVSHQGLFL
jgi:hypothetical protein